MWEDNNQLEKPSSPGTSSLGRPFAGSSSAPSDSGDEGYGNGTGERGGIHLLEIWRIVRKRSRLIVGISIVAVILITIEVYRTPSIYRAETILEVAEEPQSVVSGGERSRQVDESKAIRARKVIFKSRPVLEDIASLLALDRNPVFIESLRKRSLLEALRDIVHQSAGRLASPRPAPTPDSGATDNRRAPREYSSEESARLAPSVDVLRQKLVIDSIDDTNILSISFDHTDPVLAATIVNTAARSIIERHFNTRIARFTDKSDWLDRSTRELKSKVQQAELALADYTRRNEIFSTDDKQSLTGEKLTSLHGQAMRAEIDRMLKESLYADVQAGRLEQLPEAFADQKTAALQSELGRLRLTEAELSVKFGPDNPQLAQVRSKVDSILAQIRDSRKDLEEKLRADYERAQRDERSLKSALARAKSEAVQQNQASIQYHILNQEAETARSLYNDFLQKTSQAELQLAEQYNNIRIIEPAAVPVAPAGPRRLRTILIGLLVSLLGAVGLAFFLEYLDTTVRTVEEVGRLVQLPTLAVIPKIPPATQRAIAARRRDSNPFPPSRPESGRLSPPPAGEGRAVTPDSVASIIEAYRMLRTSVLLSTTGKPPKTILFTSSQPGEGKTTTAINTAISLAQLGASVLLIDADLRRPAIHRVFNIDRLVGLSTLLARDGDVTTLIQSLPMTNLFVLPSGPVPPNPAELLGSERMRELIRELSKRYDHIVIDSPPLVNVTDPVILSTMVDGVILVVQAGRITREIVRRARHELSSVGARIFGVVLNNLDVEKEGYAGYPAYTGYSYKAPPGGGPRPVRPEEGDNPPLRTE